MKKKENICFDGKKISMNEMFESVTKSTEYDISHTLTTLQYFDVYSTPLIQGKTKEFFAVADDITNGGTMENRESVLCTLYSILHGRNLRK